MLFSAAPVNSTPFNRKRFCCGRFPATAKLLPVRGIRNADAAGFFPGEIHDAGIQRHQFIIAAPIQRKILYLLLAHQARDIGRGDADHGRIGVNRNRLGGLAQTQREIDRGNLADS